MTSTVLFLFHLLLSFTSLLVLAQTPSERAHTLVQAMTSAEKYSLLNGVGWNGWTQMDGYYIGNTPALGNHGVPSLNIQDGPQGFRTTSTSMYGQVTSWPCALAVSSTWDVTLMNQWGVALGAEHRAKGANVILGPGVNLHRVARGGRNAEYITGEDPLLGSTMASQYVRGVQSQRVMATVKHFLFNNQETNRNTVNVLATERVMRELYLPAYEAAVEEGVGSLMCSYNLINGTHSCGLSNTLQGLLRNEWGYEGWVMSDWAAAHGVWCGVGLDQDMPGSAVDDGNTDYYSPSNLARNCNSSTIDGMVYRLLLSFITVGAFDAPVCNTGSGGCNQQLYQTTATSTEHATLARTIAAASAQVLSNNNGVLPLTESLPAGATVAVLGSACDAPYNLQQLTNTWNLGNYYIVGGSGRVINPNSPSILNSLTTRATNAGYKIVSDTSNDASAALRLVKSSGASVAVLCGAVSSTESVDRASLLVDQDSFISGVLSQRSGAGLENVPFVVTLQTAGAVLTDWRVNASAVVNMFLAGQATGPAWADVLFGDVNPSGRLPCTFPLSQADIIEPCTGTNCPYDEGLMVGYRGLSQVQVAYPFGHGLSYTTFSYFWVNPPSTGSACAGTGLACMTVKLTNTGKRDGDEVVQLYVTYPDSAEEPPAQLKGFSKVHITAGSSVIVSFALTERHLSIWDSYSHSWQVVNGTWSVFVGPSSRVKQVEGTFTL